jgi:purine-binding chemotaxis protein CheW
MNELTQLVIIRLEGRRYALPLEVVVRVVQAVEVTSLPKGPPIVLGVIDVAGDVLPVFNVRHRLKLEEREIRPSDQFVIAKTAHRTVVLVVDEAESVIARPPGDFVGSSEILPVLEQIQGVVKLGDGLALIYDLEKFLSADEARILDEAMNQESAHEA